MKYIKKEYEVLSGEIDHEPPVTKTVYEPYPSHSSTIILPDRSGGGMPLMPEPRERYDMIKACRAAGIDAGVEVIRVNHINKSYVRNPIFHGIVQRFMFHMYPGQTKYLPILVRFKVGNSGYQDLPFCLAELETLDNAIEQLNKLEAVSTPSMEQEVIKDIMRQRSGVVPFRNPNTFYH